jgi:hypothetical protein
MSNLESRTSGTEISGDLPATITDQIDGIIFELPFDDKIKLWELIYKLVLENKTEVSDEDIEKAMWEHFSDEYADMWSGETLEEVTEKEAEGRYPVLTHINPKDSPYVESKETFKHGVRFGAKWQGERIENESEQLINELESLVKDNSLGESYRAGITASIWRMKEWFEQFKNK